jgi:putative transposase
MLVRCNSDVLISQACLTDRPHSSLKYQTPEEFAAARPFDKTQWAQLLELPDGSVPAPIAHAAE